MKRRYHPIRAKLDLTQQELAHFLEIPLSTVAMCERGKRTWPTKGLLRLAQLELAWVAAENLPGEETSLVPELVEAIGKLKNRMKECLETAGLLQKMLDSMKTLSLLLKTKEKTLQLLSEPGTSSIRQGWIELQLYKIGKPLAEKSPAKQIMLEHQINTLRAEAAAAAATIEMLEQQMEEERLNNAVEEGERAALPHEPVETTFPIHTVFLSKIEMQALQKKDTVEPSGHKAFVEPPAFDLTLKINYDRTRYHRTTSTGSTPGSRLLQRNPSRRLFHQQPRQQTTEPQHPVRSRSIADKSPPPVQGFSTGTATILEAQFFRPPVQRSRCSIDSSYPSNCACRRFPTAPGSIFSSINSYFSRFAAAGEKSRMSSGQRRHTEARLAL